MIKVEVLSRKMEELGTGAPKDVEVTGLVKEKKAGRGAGKNNGN